MQFENNCPQCGDLYGTCLRKERCLEKCGHVKCWQCTYWGGPCVLCPRPSVVPPPQVAVGNPLGLFNLAPNQTAVFGNGEAQPPVVSQAAPAPPVGRANGTHSQRQAASQLASGIQRAQRKVGSRRVQTKRKVVKRFVPKRSRPGANKAAATRKPILRSRTPVNETPAVPSTSQASNVNEMPLRSLRRNSVTSTANEASGNGQGLAQRRVSFSTPAVASTSTRQRRNSVSSAEATSSGAANRGADRNPESESEVVEVHPCQICGAVMSKSKVAGHYQSHFPGYNCPHVGCRSKFTRKEKLQMHMKNAHGT